MFLTIGMIKIEYSVHYNSTRVLIEVVQLMCERTVVTGRLSKRR